MEIQKSISLIGISGHIGSGKDTVGKAIQFLQCTNTGKVTINDVVKTWEYDWWLEEQSGWEIRKFAGKLKQIASIMTGIPVEKFEDQEFKKSYLGEEWNNMQVREFLQKLGTEAVRNGLHTNAWVNATFADYKIYIDGYPQLTASNGKPLLEGQRYSMGKAIAPKWILTDCRFPNEAQAVKDRGGIVIRVNRNIEPGVKILEDGSRKYTELHPSETSLDNWNFDYVINNDSSLEDLTTKVKIMLEHFGILTPQVVNN